MRCAKRQLLRKPLTTDRPRPRRWRACACAGAGAARRRAAQADHVVKDPHYGDALFHFFQDHYFTSITA